MAVWETVLGRCMGRLCKEADWTRCIGRVSREVEWGRERRLSGKVLGRLCSGGCVGRM